MGFTSDYVYVNIHNHYTAQWQTGHNGSWSCCWGLDYLEL